MVSSADYRQMLAKSIPEEALQEQVRQMAVTLGWLYYHTHNSRHSPAGFPDCVLLKEERLVFAELKRWDKFPTQPQVIWLDALGKVSQEVYVWRPQDLLDGTIERILRGK